MFLVQKKDGIIDFAKKLVILLTGRATLLISRTTLPVLRGDFSTKKMTLSTQKMIFCVLRVILHIVRVIFCVLRIAQPTVGIIFCALRVTLRVVKIALIVHEIIKCTGRMIHFPKNHLKHYHITSLMFAPIYNFTTFASQKKLKVKNYQIEIK